MAFHAKIQRLFLAVFLLLPVINIIFSIITQSIGYFFYYNILLTLFIITLFFLKYTFTIHDGHLNFETYLMTICIYKRVIYPSQMKIVEFKRYSWTTQGALIRIRKGLNLRLVLFSPNEIFNELLTFAYKHDIQTSKSKDYQLLERRSKYITKEKTL
ncbi:hypothetical protein SAMN05518872_10658 [Psychrobacillus sp. OK032]|nr:hypothetical protein SAMN05518872_10658 [Psychrobacillus sp. OK032]